MPKRCSVDGCNKIAVSKHLCRGHGGGRRCEYPGCTKCAQSRSSFCWAHGGGKRCEAPGCMRSRKTKRFCVDHVQLEQEVAVAVAPLDLSVRTQQEPAIRNERLHRDDSEHEVRAPTISVMCNLPATQLLPSLRVALERFQDDQPRLSPPEALLPDLSRLLARRQSNSLD
ncbi:TPA: hypothetical protein N0F65_001655 [Lagenidium giganteum]|uniref:WRKY19-like zinc finger domain-containing protein n=1 Tax=Lagenidium giganteum TaxID=4803 RepID=A0AAV2YWY4_9STRA|nr:TPA: hypothetical protein N0F65_001655 [Lagenidium giganteum]